MKPKEFIILLSLFAILYLGILAYGEYCDQAEAKMESLVKMRKSPLGMELCTAIFEY